MLELQPYVFFYGKCEEALNFYKGIFGRKFHAVMRMKEAPPRSGHGLADMFWNAKLGLLMDKYGIEWFVNCDRA
jgi:uncharacterized glyoxalase superfamily protein PhnB